MSKIIPIKIRKNTEQYQKLVEAIQDIELKIYQVESIRLKMEMQYKRLKAARDKLEDEIVDEMQRLNKQEKE